MASVRASYRIVVLLLLFWGAFAGLAGGVSDEVQSARALEIEAAFLVKFSSYIHWPDHAFSSPGSPLVIGIFGRDPFGSIIDTIARSYVMKGRNIEIRRCTDTRSLCGSHIVFVSEDAMDRINEITASVAGTPVLLVGNAPDFLERGGMINFVVVNNRIRFDIDIRNSHRAGLEISSKLLKVARTVIQ